MTYEYYAYVAGPFFNKAQIERVEEVKKALRYCDVKFYSPKDDCLYVPGGDITPKQVFESNVQVIDDSDFMVAITDDRDVGTMFEAGYAYRHGTPIVYLWIDHQRRPFNIMLAESAAYVAYSYTSLRKAIEVFKLKGTWPLTTLKGGLE